MKVLKGGCEISHETPTKKKLSIIYWNTNDLQVVESGIRRIWHWIECLEGGKNLCKHPYQHCKFLQQCRPHLGTPTTGVPTGPDLRRKQTGRMNSTFPKRSDCPNRNLVKATDIKRTSTMIEWSESWRGILLLNELSVCCLGTQILNYKLQWIVQKAPTLSLPLSLPTPRSTYRQTSFL